MPNELVNCLIVLHLLAVEDQNTKKGYAFQK